jgi:hypothetical protein
MIIDWLSRTFLGKNTQDTSVNVISAQLNEPRPLPLGKAEWTLWVDRILSGVILEADRESLEYALATMILSLKPTESHVPDAFFIHSLRKSAANQVADNRRKELYAAKQVKVEAEKAAEAIAANPNAEATLERAKGLSLVKEIAVPDSKV